MQKRPVIASTSRGEKIATRLSTISGMKSFADVDSPHCGAAYWLAYDDIRNLHASNAALIQRCMFSLLCITTDGTDWMHPYDFMSGEDECDWAAIECANGNVTDLNLGMCQFNTW